MADPFAKKPDYETPSDPVLRRAALPAQPSPINPALNLAGARPGGIWSAPPAPRPGRDFSRNRRKR